MKLQSIQRSRFWRDQRANISMIWALSLLPIFMIAGLAIDSQAAFGQKDRVQHAVDSAVLAGARMLQSSNSEADGIAHARTYFSSLTAQDPNLTCNELQLTFPGNDEITATVECFQKTMLSQIVGKNRIDFKVASTATYGVGKLDVAFVFDISGSMNSYGRLADLKEAAKDAVDTLLPSPGSSSGGDVRIAMSAYNAMVDAGPFFENVTGMRANRTYVASRTVRENTCEWVCRFAIGPYCLSWQQQCSPRDVTYTSTKSINSTCVYERDGNFRFNDVQPTQRSVPELATQLPAGQKRATTDSANAHGFLATAYATYNSSNDSWTTYGTVCLSVEPFELSNNRTQIKHYIDGLYANGGTAGHQGIAWGWYLISPEWKDVFDHNAEPLSYEEPDSIKAMIIMTDGEFNSQFYNGQGNSTEQAKSLCDSIKNKKVVIYTVAFDAPDAGKDVLEYCATNPEFYFDATNGQELKDSYQAIAASISDLRIKR